MVLTRASGTLTASRLKQNKFLMCVYLCVCPLCVCVCVRMRVHVRVCVCVTSETTHVAYCSGAGVGRAGD